MGADGPSFTIFIASPQDVVRERDHVDREARRRTGRYEGELSVRVWAWEENDWDSMTHVQLQIMDPAAADLVVVILAGRLGSPLNRHGEEFVGELSGWEGLPGTVWEFERAAAARADHGEWPRVHVFVKSALNGQLDYADVQAIGANRAEVEKYVAEWVREPKVYADEEDFLLSVRQVIDDTLAARFSELLPTRRLAYDSTPFRGLEVFEPEHSDLLFGRTRSTLALRDRCEARIAASKGWVLVTGPSGSGKSSIVRAGLVPELMPTSISRNFTIGRYVIVRPGTGSTETAIRQLAGQLLVGTDAPPHVGLPELAGRRDDAGRNYDLPGVERALRNPEKARAMVAETLADLRTREAAETGRTDTVVRLIIVVDQLEELAEGRDEQFVSALVAIGDHPDVLVVATMRIDHLEQLNNRPVELADPEASLAARFDREGTFTIGPPNDAELEQIVVERTAAAGIAFERDSELLDEDDKVAGSLSELVLSDARKIRSLPMIELLLARWWEADREKEMLTYETYRALDGVAGAIGRVGDQVLRDHGYAQLVDSPVGTGYGTIDQVDDLVRTLVAMVTADGASAGAAWRKKSIARADVPRRVSDVVDALRDARLLIPLEGSPDGERIEFAHEQVLASWPVLAAWLEAARGDVVNLDQVRRAERTWEEQNRAPEQLLRGALLDTGLELLSGRRVLLESTTVAFIEQSHRKRRAERTRRWIIGGAAAAAAVGLVIAGVIAYRSSRASENERQERMALELAATARRLAGVNFDQAALLAVEASQRSDRPEVFATLVDMLASSPESPRDLIPHTAHVTALATTVDSDLFASGDLDGVIRFFDLAGEERSIITGGDHAVKSLSFARSGDVLVSADSKGQIRRWDVESGLEIGGPIAAHVGDARAVAVPNSSTIASIGHDGSVVLWDLDSGAQLVELGMHRDQGLGIAASVDGSRVASVGRDGHLLVWTLPAEGDDAASASRPIDVDLGIELRDVDFHPIDADRVAVAAQDGRVMLVDVSDGRRIELMRFQERVFTVAFASDGHSLAAAGRDGEIDVVAVNDTTDDTSPGARSLDAHTSDVEAVDFLPDGRLVSASRDSTVMMWSPEADATLTSTVLGRRAIDVSVPAEGRILVVEPIELTSRLTAVGGDGRALEQPVSAFAAAANVAVVGTESGRLELHETSSLFDGDADAGMGVSADTPDATGVLARRESAHDAMVTAIATSLNGDEIVSAGVDGRLVRWLGRSLEQVDSAQLRNDDGELVGLNAVVLRDTDGTVFAADDAGAVWRWTLTDPPTRLSDGTVRARALALSEDGEELIVGTDQDQLQVWDIGGEAIRVRVSLPHDGSVDVVAVGAGRVAAISRLPDTVTLYDLASGHSLGVVPVPDVEDVTLTADEFVAAAQSGVLVFDLDRANLAQLACTFVGRTLGPEEWEQYIDAPYEPTCP